ncbi:MAG: nicotinamidase [Thermodesulfobacteriota bacterium]
MEHYEYAPDHQQVFARAREWRESHGMAPSSTDRRNIHLVLIDMQKDFCHPSGTLYVGGRSGRGALDDCRRTAEFIYRNLDVITNITATMDNHFAFQIFFPSFWVDRDGRHLAPFREITVEDLDRGDARPNPAVAGWLANGDYAWLEKQARFYCTELEKAGKYRLYLWPPHCILGSAGHALVGAVHEARLFHSYARGVQSWVNIKGGNPLTENYSVLGPEVLMRHDGLPLAKQNTAFIKTLLTADAVVICGEAASHCVKSTIDDLLSEIHVLDKALVSKVHIVADCMSAVAVPDGKGGFSADFTPQAEEALARFADAGMHIVRSTDPIESWPGIHLE